MHVFAATFSPYSFSITCQWVQGNVVENSFHCVVTPAHTIQSHFCELVRQSHIPLVPKQRWNVFILLDYCFPWVDDGNVPAILRSSPRCCYKAAVVFSA